MRTEEKQSSSQQQVRFAILLQLKNAITSRDRLAW